MFTCDKCGNDSYVGYVNCFKSDAGSIICDNCYDEMNELNRLIEEEKAEEKKRAEKMFRALVKHYIKKHLGLDFEYSKRKIKVFRIRRLK